MAVHYAPVKEKRKRTCEAVYLICSAKQASVGGRCGLPAVAHRHDGMQGVYLCAGCRADFEKQDAPKAEVPAPALAVA